MPFAVAGAVGAIGSALIGSSASSNAANAQQQAAQLSSQTQLEELQASAGLQTPGRNLGYGADQLLAQLYGLPNPNAASTTNMYGANASLNAIGGNPATGSTSPVGGTGAAGVAAGTGSNTSAAPASGSSNYSNFFNSPGYQFALSQGQQAINRGAAANGGLYSTNTLNQLDTNAQGYASQQYNNYVQQLMGLAGIGGQSTASTVGAATTAGNNISANQLSAGNANASGILGSGSAFAGAINNSGGILGNYSALTGNSTIDSNGYLASGGGVTSDIGSLGSQGGYILSSDRRLKVGIVPAYVDSNGLQVYEFAYKTDPNTRRRGYMADEVQTVFPEAVTEDANGFLMVNYSAVV